MGAITALTAALAALTYAVLRDTNDAYARALGLTPEDLGASQGVLLAKALLLAFLITTVLVLLVGPVVLGLQACDRALDRFEGGHPTATERFLRFHSQAGGRRPWWYVALQVVGVVILVVVLGLFLGRVWVLATRLWPSVDDSVGFWAMLGVFGFVVAIPVSLISRMMREPVAQQPTALGVGAWIAITVFAALLAVWVVNGLEVDARKQAETLVAGRSRSVSPFLVELLLAGQVSPAQAVPLEKVDPLSLCDGKKVPMLIGSTSEDYLLLVFPESGGVAEGVFRAPRSHYTVVTGFDHSRPCTVPMSVR